MSQISEISRPRPSWLRRLAAMAYDAIAILAIWFFATLFIVIARKGVAVEPGNPYYTVYLLFCAYAYCAFCWTRSGQTLGMKSWKIALAVRDDDRNLDWGRAAIRFVGAILSFAACGLGFAWALVDRDGLTWHDRISKTYLYDIP